MFTPTSVSSTLSFFQPLFFFELALDESLPLKQDRMPDESLPLKQDRMRVRARTTNKSRYSLVL